MIIYLQYKKRKYYGLCGVDFICDKVKISESQRYQIFICGFDPCLVLGLHNCYGSKVIFKHEYDKKMGNFNFLNLILSFFSKGDL